MRYCGAYSHRGKARKRAAQSQEACLAVAAGQSCQTESDWLAESRRNWAALIKLVYEVDPLLCPNCHSNMKIGSVIKDGKVDRRQRSAHDPRIFMLGSADPKKQLLIFTRSICATWIFQNPS